MRVRIACMPPGRWLLLAAYLLNPYARFVEISERTAMRGQVVFLANKLGKFFDNSWMIEEWTVSIGIDPSIKTQY